MILMLIFGAQSFAQSSSNKSKSQDLRVDFSGSSAKEAYLKLEKIAAKSDSIRVTHGMGATELSSSNLNCRYTQDDSGTSNLSKVDAEYFSCYVMVDQKGDIGCQRTAPAARTVRQQKSHQGNM